MATMIGCLPTQALAFFAVFVYATHATQAIAFEWKPGFRRCVQVYVLNVSLMKTVDSLISVRCRFVVLSVIFLLMV